MSTALRKRDHAALIAPNGARVLDFSFENRVFGAKGCVFRKTPDGGVALHVPLGDVVAALPIETLRPSFGIQPGSSDDRLLVQVGFALRYVRQVRPGDSIPSELIDGTATWLADEKHLAAAKMRITMQLLAWIRGTHLDESATPDMVLDPDSPDVKRLINDAFTAIAEKLGLDASRRPEVVDLVDRIAQELSYIEALRDRFARMRRILPTLKALAGVYRRERSLVEVIVRCQALLLRPIQSILGKFAEIDANTGEILQTLRNFDAQVVYIRTCRDSLWESHLMWEVFLDLWDDCGTEPSPAAERAIREAYRFAARNFPQTSSWVAGAA
jgi:hypothetical protein